MLALTATLGTAQTKPRSTRVGPENLAGTEASVPRLKVGDRVRIRSGGPLMTVDAITSDQALCIWDDGEGITSATFPLATLMVEEPAPQ
jgi:uncharacterized protein YodC (DUF2158 family)